MRSTPLALAAGLALSSCVVRHTHPAPPPPPPAPPQPAAVVTVFDPHLEPYGEWVLVAEVGRAWRPHVRVVSADFVPYLSGGWWVYSEHGWYFESSWPFGWAVFHYGRWYFDGAFGWVWVPDTEWGAAWVEWREGGGYVGWVPLPPPRGVVRTPPRWCFVPTPHFRHPELWRHRLPPDRDGDAYHAARPVPRDHRAWPVGPPPARFEGGVPQTTYGPPPPPGALRPRPPAPPPPTVTPAPPPPPSSIAPPPPPSSVTPAPPPPPPPGRPRVEPLERVPPPGAVRPIDRPSPPPAATPAPPPKKPGQPPPPPPKKPGKPGEERPKRPAGLP